VKRKKKHNTDWIPIVFLWASLGCMPFIIKLSINEQPGEKHNTTATVTSVMEGSGGFFLAPSTEWWYNASTLYGECHGTSYSLVKVGDKINVEFFRGECQ